MINSFHNDMKYNPCIYIERYHKVYEAGARFWEEPIPADASVKFIEKYDSLLPSHRKVIEFGCGEGRDSTFLTSRGLNVLCIDIAGIVIQRAKKLAKDRGVDLEIDFIEMNALSPGLKDNYFDLAIDVAFFHLIIDQSIRSKYLNEVFRVLKRQGYFFMCNLTTNKPIKIEEILRSSLGKTITKKIIVDGKEKELRLPVIPVWPKTLEEYVNEISNAGFEIIEAYKAMVNPIGYSCVIVARKN